MWIMMKIRKGYGLKIGLVVLSIIFLFNISFHSYSIAEDSYLRVPIGQHEIDERMVELVISEHDVIEGWNRYWALEGNRENQIARDIVTFILRNMYGGLERGRICNVADIGSGCGVIAEQVVKYIESINMYTLDAAELPCWFYNEKKPYFHIRAMVEEVPFRDESIDVAILSFILAYTDKDKVVQELKRILRPGGRAILVLHHPESTIVSAAKEAVNDVGLLIELCKEVKEYCLGQISYSDISWESIEKNLRSSDFKNMISGFRELADYVISDLTDSGEVLEALNRKIDEYTSFVHCLFPLVRTPTRLFRNFDDIRQFFTRYHFYVYEPEFLIDADDEILAYGVVIEKLDSGPAVERVFSVNNILDSSI